MKFATTHTTNPLHAFSAYRFHFNGKETDNEVYGEGNVYDYGFRIYNPRIGKFLSVDPLTASYPWFTPYQFSANDPIRNIDIDGLEGGSAIEYVFTMIGQNVQAWWNSLKFSSSTQKNPPPPNAPAPPIQSPQNAPEITLENAEITESKTVEQMSISQSGLNFIKNYEKFEPKPYNDAAGNATIGYGHKLHDGPVNKADMVKYQNGITKEQAAEILKVDVVIFEKMVRDNTNVKLSQNQFDALVIFAYNTGRYEGTTLEKRVNSGESMEKIGDAFRMWNKITNEDTKKLEVSKGLVNRREDEVEMYQTGDYNRDH